MEVRKIIKFGNSSHVVSVPKSWIKENKLKKGDLIFIEKNSNGELIILPKEKKEEKIEKSIVINGKDKDKRRIEREIIAAYVDGYSLILLQQHNLKLSDLKEIVDELSGMEIIKKTLNEVVIKDILDIRTVSIPSLVRRMDNNIRSMFENLKEALEKKELRNKKYTELYEADGEVNKIYRLALKVIKYGTTNSESVLRRLEVSPSNIADVLLLVMSLEHIGDELKRIARILKNAKIKNNTGKRLENIYSDLMRIYSETMALYYKKDYEQIYDLAAKKSEIIHECDALINYDPSCREILEKFKAIEGWIYQIIKCITYFEK